MAQASANRPRQAVFMVVGVVVFLVICIPKRSGAWRLGPRCSQLGQSEAVNNLTTWQSSLFYRTMSLLKSIEKQTRTQAQPGDHRIFDLFSPFVSCPNGERLQRFGGSGDGGKLLCPTTLQPGCVVYSLGSNGEYSFEEDILGSTPCEVVTFDCTVNGKTLGPKHAFLKKCLGTFDLMQSDPQNWVTVEAAMQQLGHKQVTLLKADIEGAEYDVFAAWQQVSRESLPLQISVELHVKGIYFGTNPSPDDFSRLLWPMHNVTLGEIALFVSHLTHLGYGIVSREDNPLCLHCSELTLLKVM